MRKRKIAPQGFDREGFFLGVGMGIVFIALGLFLVWGILTAPEGATGSTGFTTAQRLARVLPHRVQEWLALGLAGLFVLFGTALFFMGLGTVVKYIAAKLTPPS